MFFARTLIAVLLLVLGTACAAEEGPSAHDPVEGTGGEAGDEGGGGEGGLGGASPVARTCSNDERPDPTAWADAIAAFATRDEATPPPSSPVVFTGSSSIALWTTLEEDMAPVPVVGNGFGGSRLSDVLYYIDPLVLSYEPQAVVIYSGENELTGTTPLPPGCVADDAIALVETLREGGLDAPLFFVSLKPSPARIHLLEEMRAINQWVEQYSLTATNVTFIDVMTPMLDDEGEPRPELFVEDGIHLSDAGYALWTGTIRPYLLDF